MKLKTTSIDFSELIARSVPIERGHGAPKSIVYLPKLAQSVNGLSTGAGDDSEIAVNPTRRSALNLEAARRQLVAKETPPFFDYSHEGVFKRSDRKCGVPTRYWWDDKRGVMVDVEWTEAAGQSLVGKVPEWDALSPHCMIRDGEAIGLYRNAGGLVNASAMGSQNRFEKTADYQELAAADPNIVAQISAAVADDETHAAQTQETEPQMKELIAKLCAKFKLDPAKATEAELIAAWELDQQGVVELTAKAGLAEPVIVVLGFDTAKPPKADELTAKIKQLGTLPTDVIKVEDHVEELIGIALKGGVIAPAEKDTYTRRLKGAERKAEFKELLAKENSVITGRVVVDTAHAGGAATSEPKYRKEARELIGKDATLSALNQKDPAAALSMAVRELIRTKPAVFEES